MGVNLPLAPPPYPNFLMQVPPAQLFRWPLLTVTISKHPPVRHYFSSCMITAFTSNNQTDQSAVQWWLSDCHSVAGHDLVGPNLGCRGTFRWEQNERAPMYFWACLRNPGDKLFQGHPMAALIGHVKPHQFINQQYIVRSKMKASAYWHLLLIIAGVILFISAVQLGEIKVLLK